MTVNLSKGLYAATVLSITIVGGCNHPRSTPEGATAAPKITTIASKDTAGVSTEIWPAMVGKQITIRGKFLSDKMGWVILLDNQQEVYFFPKSSTFGSYDEMQGKLVTATGILKVFQCPKNQLTDEQGRPVNKKGQIIDRCSNFYYFEAGTGQPKLFPDGK